MKYLVAFGTRPEVIKLAPVINELKRRGADVQTLFTGQHESLFEDVSDMVELDKRLFYKKFSDPVEMLCHILNTSYGIVKNYDIIIVQGDTTSAFAIALAAFYAQKRVVHIEAGLRSWNRFRPFPEEMHRVLIDSLATILYCPSVKCCQNVRMYSPWMDQTVINSGNTVYDALEEKFAQLNNTPTPDKKIVLVTVHRRESFGKPIRRIFNAVTEIAASNKDMQFVIPLHPNPNVQECRTLLFGDNINIIEPLSYEMMVELMARATIIMTDSGGVMEEAIAFGRRPIILREETERDELVTLGAAVMGGTVEYSIIRAFDEVKNSPTYDGKNPYGNGGAARTIVDTLLSMRIPA